MAKQVVWSDPSSQSHVQKFLNNQGPCEIKCQLLLCYSSIFFCMYDMKAMLWDLKYLFFLPDVLTRSPRLLSE